MTRTLPYLLLLGLLAQTVRASEMSDAERKQFEAQIKGLDKDEVHKLVRTVEAEPLGEMASIVRPALLTYFEDIPFQVCLDQLGPLVGSKNTFHRAVFWQVVFSSGDFILQHPESATNKYAYQLAGLEGALRAYEQILAAKPKARLEFLDGLLEQRNGGRLGEYVKANPCENK